MRSIAPTSFNVFTFCLVDTFATAPAHMGRRPALYAWMSLEDRARALDGAAQRLELAALVLAVRASLEGVSEVPLEVLTRRGVRSRELAEVLAAFRATRTLEDARLMAPTFQHWDALTRSVQRLSGRGTWVQLFEAAMAHMDTMRAEAGKFYDIITSEKAKRAAQVVAAEEDATRRLRATMH